LKAWYVVKHRDFTCTLNSSQDWLTAIHGPVHSYDTVSAVSGVF